MSNTYDSDLVSQILSETAISVAGKALAPFSAFARDFSSEAVKPSAAIAVPISKGGTVRKNPSTDRGVGNQDFDSALVKFDRYEAVLGLSSDDLQDGFKVQLAAETAMNDLSEKLQDVCFSLFTNSSGFADSDTAGAATTFTADKAKQTFGEVKGRHRHLMLEGSAYGPLLPSDRNGFELSERGGYGFQGIHEADFAAADSGVYGVACGDNALAIASALPFTEGGNFIVNDKVTLPVGVTVAYRIWADDNLALRSHYEVMFGAAVADSGNAVLLKG